MSDQTAQAYEQLIHAAELARDREQIVDVDEETEQLVVFKLADQLFAMPGRYVRELIPTGDIVHVPGTSPLFLGVIPVRGDIVSVLDLARLLGMPPSTIAAARTRSGRILMVAREEMNTGMLVDAVTDIIDAPGSAIQPQLSTLDPQLARLADGQLLFNGQPTPILNVASLFQTLQEACA
ncbi:MAG: chemotaxis protein CheW [Magnetococcus sp. DMHC-8]